MEFLKAKSNKIEKREGEHERFNVYATMLLKMSEALMSKQLTHLDFENQNRVLEIFVDFIGEQMEDYRLRDDRSRFVSDSVKKSGKGADH